MEYPKIKVIYQDNDFLAVSKPPGLVVDPADTVAEKTLADILIEDFNIDLPRGGIVHRLDKDTSGVILVAKTLQALESLQSQFKERIVKKEYLALAHGVILESITIDGAIGRNPGDREKFAVIADGKEAVTEFEPVKNVQFTMYNLQTIFPDFNKIQMRKLERQKYGEVTLVRCKPKTGRTHQIRVHLKYTNHPIVADEKYVGRKMFRLDSRWCPRIFLHAEKIGFKHPVSGEWMELESRLPEDLEGALDLLSKNE
ncbi:RluA family pseudouridine synthase [Candidatus Daviesbacteria bacterium]|nr:RluA family pseudouridine synthase [Candidatus Daviesbacteria bacterium]